jgi:hypothetical protein
MKPFVTLSLTFTIAALAVTLAACGGDDVAVGQDAGPDAGQIVEGACQIVDPDAVPDSLATITCKADFEALASQPLDATLPGARSVKVVLDREGGDALYFQNSVRFQIHYAFASTHLSGNGRPIVGTLADFNSVQYFSPDRRFILGAVTYYEQPQKWVLELAPYDTASAAMIEQLFLTVKHLAYVGPDLAFHPTSEALATTAASLPSYVPVLTTDELYAGTDFQPLSLGTAYGRLHFTTVAALESEFLSFQDIPVLDEAPNDISVVQGLITEEFQTPLSHVNVLSRNRHTPNMGLRGATTNPTLRALDGQLVKLVVTSQAWTVEPTTALEAQAWWDSHAPEPVTLPEVDLTVTAFTDIENVTAEPTADLTMRDAIRTAVRAFGGKAAHYSLLYRTPGLPIKRAFAVPIYYYDQFMRQNGFYDRVDGFLADETFRTDPAARDAALAQMRADMLVAPLDPQFVALLTAKAATFPGVVKLRFRTSSNSEDLDGFPCAGCYNSYSGAIASVDAMSNAIRKVYADIWTFRTFEERTYYRVDHRSVGMALLVHENFEDEEANGVAVTSNPFDASRLDPAFYVNVQIGGDVEVVAPPPGTTSDQVLYYFNQPNQPITYLTHSNMIDPGTTVLTSRQMNSLGAALSAIHTRFSPAYGPASGNDGWYAMDIEFKFDDQLTPGSPTLYVKQARPYPDPFAGLDE